MRALLFEVVIILIYVTEGNQDAALNNPRKNAKKISYDDLRNTPVGFSSMKDEKVLFESSSPPQIPDNSSFKYTFKKLYTEATRLTVTLDDIVNLVENNVLNETQAIMMWDALVKNKTVSLDFPKLNFLTYFGNVTTTAKEVLGHFPMFLIFLSGYIVLLFVYVYLGLTFYVKYAYWALIILSTIFLYNFYYLTHLMKGQYSSIVFSSVIYNTIFFIAVILGHSLLCATKIQNDVVKWQEILDASHNFEGKVILSVYSTMLGYLFAFRCNFFIAHLPFFLSTLFLVYVLAKKAAPYFGSSLQPLTLFSVSMYGFFIFFYIYTSNEFCWQPSVEIIDLVNSIFRAKIFNTTTDFRYAGLLVSSTVILAGFPLYLLVQSLNLGRDYLSGRFTYRKVFDAIKGAQVKPTFSEDSTGRSLWLFSYGVLTVLAMYLGFRIHVHYIVILAIFGLQSFNGIYAKEKGFTNMFFFYTSGFITVNASFLLGQVEDQFSEQILGEHRNGYFILTCEAIIRMVLNYYAFAICSANITSQEMGRIASLNDIFVFIVKYILNYLFAIYLVVMATMEKNVIHSLFYSVSAVVSFSRVLLYSSSRNDPNARLLISLAIYLSGLRITLIGGDLSVPFYFGCLLMNFSVFVTYTTFTHSLAIPIAVIYFAGLLSYALLMKSSFMLVVIIINICGLFATRMTEAKDKMLKIFLTLLATNFIVFAVNKFNFGVYYQSVDAILSTFIPNAVSKYWTRTLEDKDLVEYSIVRGIINQFLEIL